MKYFLILFLGLLWCTSPVISQTPDLRVMIPDITVNKNHTFTISIAIQQSPLDTSFAVGSFTCTITWNNACIAYESNSGVIGFTGVVNDANASSGQLIFNGVNPYGKKGYIHIMDITFKGVSDMCFVHYSFSALAAAKTFVNLLPYLDAKDSKVTVGVSDGLGNNALKLFPPRQSAEGAEVSIPFQLPYSDDVELQIYGSTSILLGTVLQERLPEGFHEVRWSGTNYPAGIYFVCLRYRGESLSKSFHFVPR